MNHPQPCSCDACKDKRSAARVEDLRGTCRAPQNSEERAIIEECTALAAMLIDKNRAYGNSALDPIRVFSKADTKEQIRVRIDDKLSRLARGSAAGEDVTLDLLGYLILLRIAERAL